MLRNDTIRLHLLFCLIETPAAEITQSQRNMLFIITVSCCSRRPRCRSMLYCTEVTTLDMKKYNKKLVKINEVVDKVMRKPFQLLLKTKPLLLLLLQCILVYYLLWVFKLTSVCWFWMIGESLTLKPEAHYWHWMCLKRVGSLRCARVQLSAGSFKTLHPQTWGISTKQRGVSGRSLALTPVKCWEEKKKKKAPRTTSPAAAQHPGTNTKNQ